MERVTWGRPLRDHVRQVARALGSEPHWAGGSVWLPLDDDLYGFPGREAALRWDAVHGWSAVIDDPEPLVVAYLGNLAPTVETVVAFVADLVAGRRTGQAEPPAWPRASAPCAYLVG